MNFKLKSKFKPSGDQPSAIEKLVKGIKSNAMHQTLLGVTGSGKTFTIANVINKVQKPTLVICHNKTLAAQLCQEYREFFPENAVEYFVSYYDYYQPEAYLPTTDTYIEKEAEINQEIDRLRHAATSALLSRKDTIIVASVSCIYGLGSPEEYENVVLELKTGDTVKREEIINSLVNVYFTRSDILSRGRFRAKGGTIDIMPTSKELIYRIIIENNKIEKIFELENLSYKVIKQIESVSIFPAKHFVVSPSVLNDALKQIEKEKEARVKYFMENSKFIEAERIEQRTNYDLEMIREIGYCNGIENYSRYLTNRAPGQPPFTLIDYFPNDYLLVIDESHVTVPQIGGMYEGDKSRKQSLIEHGFRLPSALDNRPLKFNEFEKKTNQTIYTTATPGKYELEKSCPSLTLPKCQRVVEQIVRPTGLVDPEITIKPIENQVGDVINEIEKVIKNHERVLITTLTKKMAEDLSGYLKEKQIHSKYLHSDIETIERIRTLEELRRGKFDVLVGVNLLREGLDLPEVSLVAILDADKEGFLRSESSLIQTMGRAARNVSGKVILYADETTGSMKRAIDESKRRRKIQIEYNKKHNITPQTIKKAIKSIVEQETNTEVIDEYKEIMNLEDIPKYIKEKERDMKRLAKELRFEEATVIRDEINQLKKITR
jgi:excinuclease ABC subunit B